MKEEYGNGEYLNNKKRSKIIMSSIATTDTPETVARIMGWSVLNSWSVAPSFDGAEVEYFGFVRILCA